MNLRLIVPICTCFIAISAIATGMQNNIWLLLIAGTAFIASRLSEGGWIRLVAQLVFLGLFHWASGNNWCFPFYLIISCENVYPYHSKLRYVITNTVCILMYCANHLLIAPRFSQSILQVILYLICFPSLAVFYQRLIISHHQKLLMDKEKDHLSTHDRLTGLLNFEEFHRRLGDIAVSGKQLALMLVDCTDLKSMNTTKGFHEGNQILKQMANLLKVSFPESIMFARYGGDEFAFVVDLLITSDTLKDLKLRLDSGFPKLMGLRITYGMAIYPDDAGTKDDLILAAEQRLFTMKREQWLKREEHMFRAEKLKVVGELASGMAHEIRNPLTAIKGFLQLSKANGYQVENWYPLIMDEISRMSELTAEFLQFSKPHATHFKEQPLQDCIRRALHLMDSEALRLGHVIDYEAPTEQVPIMMDQDKIVQLLLNLVKNAFDAMERNGRLQIRLSRSETHCTVTVKDSGKGISQEEMDKIFDPFYTSKAEGTGLGLSICQKIVQDHDGIMELESTPNVGTTFVITFPAAGGTPQPQPSQPPNAPAAT